MLDPSLFLKIPSRSMLYGFLTVISFNVLGLTILFLATKSKYSFLFLNIHLPSPWRANSLYALKECIVCACSTNVSNIILFGSLTLPNRFAISSGIFLISLNILAGTLIAAASFMISFNLIPGVVPSLLPIASIEFTFSVASATNLL